MAEIIIMLVALAITAGVMVPLWRWTRRKGQEARRLADEGYVCIGCPLFVGPVMVPPEALYPPEVARRIREEARAARSQQEGAASE